jgi:ribonuclease D
VRSRGVRLIDFILIQRNDQLLDLVKQLKQEQQIAVDLECENNLHHYGSYIALIQISTKTQNYVIDVLALDGITPLCHILESKEILKVFHDVDFDFRILNKQFKCHPKRVFDTKIASLFLGEEAVGLGSLLEKYFKVNKEKKFQKVDWTKRPMTAEQLSYAVNDTTHLLELKKVLIKKLREKNRLDWVLEECRALDYGEYPLNEQKYLDVKGARSLKPVQLAVLHALFDERKKLAQKVDRPFFKVFGNKQLVAFAQRPPHDWRNLRGVHPEVRRNAKHFQVVVREAMQSKGEKYPRPLKKRLVLREYKFIKDLTAERTVMAKKRDIPGYLLLNVEQIKELVLKKTLKHLKLWQQQILKQEKLIKQILAK